MAYLTRSIYNFFVAFMDSPLATRLDQESDESVAFTINNATEHICCLLKT